MSSSPLNLDPIVVPLVRGTTVLDVGCGYGRWGCLIRTNFWEAGLDKPPLIDGVDAYIPNVEAAAALGTVYRRVWHQLLPSPLDGRWDTVLACEFLEHLPASDVGPTLELLESAATQRVIVSTPNARDLRDGHETLHGFNDLEAHLSFTHRRVLKARGYRILGVGFGPPNSALKKLAGSSRVSRDLSSLTLHIPRFAESYVAYKDVSQ